MQLLPFDPADYLDSEEAIAAYLADARAYGTAEYADAAEVVARARKRHAGAHQVDLAALRTHAERLGGTRVYASAGKGRSMPGSKRELLEVKGDKRYVRRNPDGTFKESEDVSRSLSKDVKQRAKTTVPSGQGDRGDQKRKK